MISAALLPGPVTISGTTFDIHTLLYSSMSVVLGFQLILFAMFTKIFAISEGLLPEDPRLDRMFEYIRLEAGLLGGALLFGLGAVLSILAYLRWSQEGFGDLDPGRTFRIVIPAVLLIILGVQTIFSSFFLSVLGLKRQN
jgi:hypothetical protein